MLFSFELLLTLLFLFFQFLWSYISAYKYSCNCFYSIYTEYYVFMNFHGGHFFNFISKLQILFRILYENSLDLYIYRPNLLFSWKKEIIIRYRPIESTVAVIQILVYLDLGLHVKQSNKWNQQQNYTWHVHCNETKKKHNKITTTTAGYKQKQQQKDRFREKK